MITVLVNPTAGGNTSDPTADIAAAFEALGVTPRMVTLRPGDDVAALARDAARTSRVVAAGGDVDTRPWRTECVHRDPNH